MNKKALILLTLLWLALCAATSAYYDPSTRSFLSRDPIREAGGINLYAYCNNDPVGNFDPIGLQGSYPGAAGWMFTQGDYNRAVSVGAILQTGRYTPEQALSMVNQSEAVNQMGRDALKVYVGTMIAGSGVATGGAGPGLIGVLGDVALASGGAMVQQSANNVIDGYPWSQGVPQAGESGLLFGAGGSVIGRGVSGVLAGRISLRLPRFFRTVRAPGGIAELPLGYEGGPGAMWVGENLGTIPKTTTELRLMPGTATGGESLSDVTGRWLRGTEGNAGVFPKQIAEQMRGIQFETFDEFRNLFWQKVVADPVLAPQFSLANRTLMGLGKAPFALPSQVVGGGFAQRVYNLHHITPIEQGGGIYDLDNLLIASPRFHLELHDY